MKLALVMGFIAIRQDSRIVNRPQLDSTMHHYQDLINLFDNCFATTHQTRLLKGGDEPLYLPANEENSYHTLFFAHGYFSSALHECAHWFIAGIERRQQLDYGYWYAPDGRTAEQQKSFQLVEIKPQALEWILSIACNHKFEFSIDNLNGEPTDTLWFKKAVYQQALHYLDHGLPRSAELFRKKLCEFYGTPYNYLHFINAIKTYYQTQLQVIKDV
jgi:elongation factor P hydroxylase